MWLLTILKSSLSELKFNANAEYENNAQKLRF